MSAADRLADEARAALASGDEAQLIGRLEAEARRADDASLWQWAGLLHRSLDDHAQAIEEFDRAARIAPRNAGIAHGLARVRFEAGLDARDHYARALTLAPDNGEVLIGGFAARTAMGEGAAVSDELAALLERHTGWIAGHHQFAQLQALLSRSEQAASSIDAALRIFPRDPALWQARLDLAVRREEFATIPDLLSQDAAAALGPDSAALYAAIGASETGALEQADDQFARVPADLAPLWRLRFLLRAGRLAAALPLIDQMLAGPERAETWPYAHAAWRMAGDPRADWLLGESIRTFDLTDQLPPLDRLADLLRQLHHVSGEYLDQSVRGGTQTDGPLFSRIDSDLRAVRGVVLDAVDRYRRDLAPIDPNHPLLGLRRDRRLRFAGSWSVRLRAGGNHANHVHPQGWISSALYIALPDSESERRGWLTLGQPQASLGLALAPSHYVEPRPGRLVLFPSWLWHGTIPFETGERLTIAFDIAPPR